MESYKAWSTNRRFPVQARAKATVEKIKKASLDLLREEGLEALNTNSIAEQAGVNISTLYAYYPDKYTILYDLFDSFEETRSHYVLEKMQELTREGDWQEWFFQVIEGLADYRLKDPAGIALRRALILRPELHELDIESSKVTWTSLADIFEIEFSIDKNIAASISEIVIESITHMLDSAFSVSPPRIDKVDELKVMITRYLFPYLSGKS